MRGVRSNRMKRNQKNVNLPLGAVEMKNDLGVYARGNGESE